MTTKCEMHLLEDSGCFFVQEDQHGGIVLTAQRAGLHIQLDITSNDAKRIAEMLLSVTSEESTEQLEAV